MDHGTDTAGPFRERARLDALARVAEAAAHGGGLDGVLEAIVEGVRTAFGFNVVLNLLDPKLASYAVRAVAGDGPQVLMGSRTGREAFEEILDPAREVVPDVFFIPHDAPVDSSRFGAYFDPPHEWTGPGYWHPEDMCFVRLRTSQGTNLGILSVDSPVDDRVPDRETFELLQLFAVVGANAAENMMLLGEVAGLEAEREMRKLRRELEEELVLRQSLLEIGSRIGAASQASPRDMFPLVSERLATVVPIKSLSISMVDHNRNVAHPVYHSEAGPVADAVLGFDVPFGVGVTGAAVERQSSVINNHGEPEYPSIQIPGTPEVGEHVLAVPVMMEDRVKVVLTLRRAAEEAPFVPQDARRAELFAQHLNSAFLLSELADSRRLLAEQVKKLEHMNTLKDEFVANVSHDLRTALTAIIGNVVTVAGLGDMLGADERRELLVAAERQAKGLAELLENLLAESRLTGEEPVAVPVQVEVGPFVEEIAAALRFRAPGRAIRAKAPPRVVVWTDRTLLYRILFNLTDNALKYSEGPVDMRVVKGQEGWVGIEVKDEGIGIPPEDLSRVFDRFERLSAARGRAGGVGLGLHLTQRAAQALGGRIEVQSERGKGSTFTVWLPSSAEPPEPAPEQLPLEETKHAPTSLLP